MDYNPILFTWNSPCEEVYVTGDFNDFALTQLHGNSQKVAVCWTQLKEVNFRYLVDGDYLHKENLPTRLEDGIIWNILTVEQLSNEVRTLGTLSLEELEELDHKFTSNDLNTEEFSDICSEEGTQEIYSMTFEEENSEHSDILKSWLLANICKERIYRMRELLSLFHIQMVKKRYKRREKMNLTLLKDKVVEENEQKKKFSVDDDHENIQEVLSQ